MRPHRKNVRMPKVKTAKSIHVSLLEAARDALMAKHDAEMRVLNLEFAKAMKVEVK